MTTKTFKKRYQMWTNFIQKIEDTMGHLPHEELDVFENADNDWETRNRYQKSRNYIQHWINSAPDASLLDNTGYNDPFDVTETQKKEKVVCEISKQHELNHGKEDHRKTDVNDLPLSSYLQCNSKDDFSMPPQKMSSDAPKKSDDPATTSHQYVADKQGGKDNCWPFPVSTEKKIDKTKFQASAIDACEYSQNKLQCSSLVTREGYKGINISPNGETKERTKRHDLSQSSTEEMNTPSQKHTNHNPRNEIISYVNTIKQKMNSQPCAKLISDTQINSKVNSKSKQGNISEKRKNKVEKKMIGTKRKKSVHQSKSSHDARKENKRQTNLSSESDMSHKNNTNNFYAKHNPSKTKESGSKCKALNLNKAQSSATCNKKNGGMNMGGDDNTAQKASEDYRKRSSPYEPIIQNATKSPFKNWQEISKKIIQSLLYEETSNGVELPTALKSPSHIPRNTASCSMKGNNNSINSYDSALQMLRSPQKVKKCSILLNESQTEVSANKEVQSSSKTHDSMLHLTPCSSTSSHSPRKHSHMSAISPQETVVPLNKIPEGSRKRSSRKEMLRHTHTSSVGALLQHAESRMCSSAVPHKHEGKVSCGKNSKPRTPSKSAAGPKITHADSAIPTASSEHHSSKSSHFKTCSPSSSNFKVRDMSETSLKERCKNSSKDESSSIVRYFPLAKLKRLNFSDTGKKEVQNVAQDKIKVQNNPSSHKNESRSKHNYTHVSACDLTPKFCNTKESNLQAVHVSKKPKSETVQDMSMRENNKKRTPSRDKQLSIAALRKIDEVKPSSKNHTCSNPNDHSELHNTNKYTSDFNTNSEFSSKKSSLSRSVHLTQKPNVKLFGSSNSNSRSLSYSCELMKSPGNEHSHVTNKKMEMKKYYSLSNISDSSHIGHKNMSGLGFKKPLGKLNNVHDVPQTTNQACSVTKLDSSKSGLKKPSTTGSAQMLKSQGLQTNSSVAPQRDFAESVNVMKKTLNFKSIPYPHKKFDKLIELITGSVLNGNNAMVKTNCSENTPERAKLEKSINSISQNANVSSSAKVVASPDILYNDSSKLYSNDSSKKSNVNVRVTEKPSSRICNLNSTNSVTNQNCDSSSRMKCERTCNQPSKALTTKRDLSRSPERKPQYKRLKSNKAQVNLHSLSLAKEVESSCTEASPSQNINSGQNSVHFTVPLKPGNLHRNELSKNYVQFVNNKKLKVKQALPIKSKSEATEVIQNLPLDDRDQLIIKTGEGNVSLPVKKVVYIAASKKSLQQKR